MQSWGERSTFADRDTASFPTRSGLTGLFAAAMGIGRGAPLDRFHDLTLTVRVDHPGVPLTDFHTVGGGLPPNRTVPIANGKHRSGDTGTVVSRRRYLADAVFTVAVTGPDELVDEIGAALLTPRWQPYLGRRSCPPDQPFVLRTRAADAESDLRERVPLPRRRGYPAAANGQLDVDIISETDAAGTAGAATTRLADLPISLDPHERIDPLERRFQVRHVHREAVPISTALLRRPGRDYQEALFRYMKDES
jgi:CRISPR system Cascade subunit CasD